MTALSTDFTKMLCIEHPIVQGPMNGASTPELTAAVSNAGGLGSYAAALLPPSAILEGVRKIRSLTSKPFNVNLFILDTPSPDHSEMVRAQSLLAPFRTSLNLGPALMPEKFCEDFQLQLEALLKAAPQSLASHLES
jgi:nitronate monooxygenase